MKIIKKENFDSLFFAPKGNTLNQTVKEILKLNLNEAMVIGLKEWTLKQPPTSYFYRNAEKWNGMFFKVRKLANDEGWAILRIS